MKEFEDLIETLFNAKLESVSVLKSDTDLKSRFSAYMHEKYDEFVPLLENNAEIKAKMIDDWYNTELRHWGELSVDAKYSMFTHDEALVEIDSFSCMIYSLAQKKFTGGEIDQEDVQNVKKYVERMNALLPNVIEENKVAANKLISEGLVDANYVYGDSECLSLRLSNMTYYMKLEN